MLVRHRAPRVLAMAVAVAVSAACSAAQGAPPPGSRSEVARSVILLVGDGLGQAQRDLLRSSDAGENGDIAMDRFEARGLLDTSPAAGNQVSDAAAAATAIATGVRTHPGSIGVDIDGVPLPTVLEHARDAGKATGIVTTGPVTGPTPAAFAAHVTRDDESGRDEDVLAAADTAAPDPDEEPRGIARQYLDQARVDVLLGGGREVWQPGAASSAATGAAAGASVVTPTRPDLVATAIGRGYRPVAGRLDLPAATRADRLLGLFTDGDMFEPGPLGSGGYAPPVTLADLTESALTVLDRRENGFFLLVNEAGIDAMARRHNTPLLLEATRSFDAAVDAARQYQAGHPDTLVVVAGGYESGGLQLTRSEPLQDGPISLLAGTDGPYPVADSDGEQMWARWTADGPTGRRVPVTAGGPGAAAFTGELPNTALHTGIMQALDLTDQPG